MNSGVTCVWNCRTLLGEGPIWHPEKELLLFVDIAAKRLFSWSCESKQTFSLARQYSSIAIERSSKLVLCGENVIDIYEFPLSAPLLGVQIPDLSVGSRLNDCKCDVNGRLLVGSMDVGEKEPIGSLWTLDFSLCPKKIANAFIVGNGIGWSPDSKTLYVADSGAGYIYKFDYDDIGGTIRNKDVFAQIPKSSGSPDGLCVDSNGYVWSAHWDGWGVSRYAPNGQIADFIELPVPRVTSVAFGGKDMNKLFITSASIGLSAERLRSAPLSGSLFMMTAPCSGLPVAPFDAGELLTSKAGKG